MPPFWSLQPASPARTRPQAIAIAPPATSGTAGRSSRLALPRLSGRYLADMTAAASPIGTLIQKIQCQLSPCTTTPPTSGPPATAKPPMPPQIPTTAPRRAGRNAPVKMVRLSEWPEAR